VAVAVAAELTPAGIPLPAQELVHLGAKGSLKYQPRSLAGKLVESVDDLADDFRAVYLVDVIACDHRDVPPSDDWLVNRKGTSLMTYRGPRPALEFPHIPTLALLADAGQSSGW